MIKRLTNDDFREFYMATIGVDYDRIMYNYKDNENEIILWDTSGQDKFNFLLNSYFSSVNAALILCDVNVPQSFTQAKNWISEFRIRKNNENIPIVFIANKIDRKDRCVTTEQIKNVEKEFNVKTIEISLKNNVNVEKILLLLLDDFNEKIADNRISLENDNIRTLKTKKSSFKLVEQKEVEPRCCNIL